MHQTVKFLIGNHRLVQPIGESEFSSTNRSDLNTICSNWKNDVDTIQKRLNKNERHLLVLRHRKNKSMKEIADEMHFCTSWITKEFDKIYSVFEDYYFETYGIDLRKGDN